MSQPKNTESLGTSGVFVSTLTAMHSGAVLADLDEALRDLTKSVNAAQSKGKLVLEITVSPNGQGIGETPLFKVEDKVKVTLPKKPRPHQSFFADEENNLTRRNPHQDEMKLSVVAENGTKAPALKAASS